MKEKNKNRNDTLSDFIRYTRGEMSKREENSFQRKLQKDPFAAEAAEGFSEISPREADDDLKRLGKKLKNRIKPGQRKVYYRSAASVAVLMIISSVFLYVERNKPARQLSQEAVKPAPPEKTTDSKDLVAAPEKEAEKQVANGTKDAAIPDEIVNPSVTEKTEALALIEKKDTLLYVAENKISEQPDAAAKQDNAALNESKVKPDTQLLAANEVVTVGYGAVKSSRAVPAAAEKADSAGASYIPSQPVNGKTSFDNYVRENIQKPAVLVAGQTVTVFVSFIVRSSGTIDSINVITSPGKEYSDESVRLIREGPSWKPAERNNEKIDDYVRMPIVFK
jgi:TonB family protein